MKNKLGIDTIIILIAIIVTAICLIIVLLNKGEVIEDPVGGSESSGLQAIKQANDSELFNFNQRLSGYSGNQSGKNLKALVTRVDTINEDGKRHVTLVGADNLEEDATYNVTMDYDGEGYISTIKLEKK